MRQHAVYDENVVLFRRCEQQPLFTVTGVVRNVSRFLYTLLDIGRGVDIIFYDEDSHIHRRQMLRQVEL